MVLQDTLSDWDIFITSVIILNLNKQLIKKVVERNSLVIVELEVIRFRMKTYVQGALVTSKVNQQQN